MNIVWQRSERLVFGLDNSDVITDIKDRQRVIVNVECPARKLFVSHVHGSYLTDIGILLVLTDNQHRFCLILQLSTNMATSVVVILVKVEHAMDMQIILARPCHQHRHYVCRLLGIVDVVHQISQSIYDNQSVSLAFSECIIN